MEAFQDGVRLAGDAVCDAYAKSWVQFPEDVDIWSYRLYNQPCDQFKVIEKYNRLRFYYEIKVKKSILLY